MEYNSQTVYDATPTIDTPASGPRPKKGEMPKAELQTLVSGLISSSRNYIQTDLQRVRAKATKYYKSEQFGNEQAGRSKFVMSEVHDGVQAVLPSIMRVVFGPDAPVEYRPRKAESADQAAQVTDYVRYVFEEENDGFLKTRAVLMDGLLRRHGIFKWGWDEAETTTQEFHGSLDDLALLASDDGIEVTLVRDMGEGMLEAEFTRTSKEGKLWIDAVPPEEFIAVRESRSLTDSIFVAHQTRLTSGELIKLGVKQKQIDDHGGDDPSMRDDEVALERAGGLGLSDDSEAGRANDRHLYVEGYARIDYDGDGVAELRKVCTLGPGYHVVMNVPADELPFSVWCPDPEPHSLLGGRSWADRLMDMQRLKSELMRGLLDSASASIFPRKWYKDGDANLTDIMSTRIGTPIRTRSGQGAVGEFAHSFMGQQLLPVLEMCNSIVERRTGSKDGTMGLDADALQSSTQAAVAAAITGAQAQQEMLVRVFAEGALKPMFRGVLKLFAKHKPKKTTAKLRGTWVEIDPASWDATMDVQVNVALGSGLIEEKISTLAEISSRQEAIIEKMGQDNPLVDIKQYRDTLVEMIALRGRKDGARYFKPITDEQIKQMAEAAKNTPPPPSPEMELAKAQIEIEKAKAEAKQQSDQAKTQMQGQLEQVKAQIDAQRAEHEAMLKMKIEEMKLVIEREKMSLEDDRERDKQAADIQLKIAEMELQFQTNLDELEITSQIERERIQSQAAPGESAPAAPKKKTRTVTKSGPKPRKRQITVQRDAGGRAAGYTVEDVSEDM